MIDYGKIFDEQAVSYAAYRQLIDNLLAEGKTTGDDHAEFMVNYTKLNVHRMSRLDKTVVLTDELKKMIDNLEHSYRLLVISEGWCGDAAQIVPVFNAITEQSHWRIKMGLVLRDEHPDLINAHLTNGGKAIPVLLVLNEQNELLASWGPRPAVLQGLVREWKAKMPIEEAAEELHGWYAKDRTKSTQEELLAVFGKLS